MGNTGMWVFTHAAGLAAIIVAAWALFKVIAKFTTTKKDDEVIDKLEPYVEKGVDALEKVAEAQEKK